MMKTKIFSVMSLLLLLCVTPSKAQDDIEDIIVASTRFKNYHIFVGPKAGLTFTSMSQPSDWNLYDGNNVGFSGGLAAKIRLGRPNAKENDYVPGSGAFGLGIEAKYVVNSVKTTGSDNLTMSYFEVPVFARLYPAFKSTKAMNSFFLEAGFAVAGTMSKSPDVLEAGIYSYKTGDLKGFDVRPFFGLGISFPNEPNRANGNNHLEINGRYYIGTSDLAGNMPCKMSHMEISLAYMFGIKK